MLKPNLKTALVTHKGCLDGTGSALMFVWAGGRRENIIFKNPSMAFLTPDEAAPFDEVWFADVCPSTLDEPAGGKPFLVFDHHVSNMRKYGGDPRFTFDMEKSGTSLMAHVLGITDNCDDVTRQLIDALESYDLGRFSYEPGTRLADIAASFSQEEMLDIMASRDPEEILWDRDLSNRADALSSVRKLYAEQAAKNAFAFEFPDGIDAAVIVSPVFWKNEVANRILLDRDLAVIVDPVGQMVSLRSKVGGPDCSELAGRYGGGGHARAAGFKIDRAQLLSSIVEVILG